MSSQRLSLPYFFDRLNLNTLVIPSNYVLTDSESSLSSLSSLNESFISGGGSEDSRIIEAKKKLKETQDEYNKKMALIKAEKAAENKKKSEIKKLESNIKKLTKQKLDYEKKLLKINEDLEKNTKSLDKIQEKNKEQDQPQGDNQNEAQNQGDNQNEAQE